MKKLIMIAIVLVIARPQVAMSCIMWPPSDCRNMGEVYWEFEDDGCMPTSDEYDPAYCFWPEIANPTFGSRHWDDPYDDSGWGGSYGSDLWEWSDGGVTIPPFAEDSFNQPIPERGDKKYLRQYFEVVHTMPTTPDPFGSIIGIGLEIWDMSVYQESGWTGCPVGYEGLPGDGYINGDEFPAPESTTELGDGWYKTIWITDFAPDDSLGEEGVDIGEALHDEATHTYCIVGMEVPSSFQIDEVYIKMVWHDYSGGITPDEFWYCTCFGPPPPPPEPPLEFDPGFAFLCEPQDAGGPPPECPISGTVGVRLKWQPEEPDDVHVLVDPNPDSDMEPNTDLILPASTEPNGVVRLVFNQANYHEWQTVVMEAAKDIEREGNENHLVRFSTQTSGDPNFDGYEELRSNPIIDNDIPWISYLPHEALLDVLTENDPGEPACVNVTLSHMPYSEVEVRGELVGSAVDMVIMDPNFEAWTDPNHLLFHSCNYNIPQQICLKALNDDEATEVGTEWIAGQIILNGFSDDPWYQSSDEGGELDETEIYFNVQDNDCGAWGYDHRDVNKDCYVNLADFALFYSQWLLCVQPYGDGCDKLWNLIEEE